MFKKILLGFATVVFIIYSVFGIKLLLSYMINNFGTLGIVAGPIIAGLLLMMIIFIAYCYFQCLTVKPKTVPQEIKDEKAV